MSVPRASVGPESLPSPVELTHTAGHTRAAGRKRRRKHKVEKMIFLCAVLISFTAVSPQPDSVSEQRENEKQA